VTDPLYRRIAQDLRQRIQSGELARGTQLPTELELRESYEASRNTIRDAIKWLVSNGLVETRPGQGTFVAEKIEAYVTTLSAGSETGLGGDESDAVFAEVRERGRVPTRTGPRVALLAAVGNVAARLNIAEGTQVVSRHWERFIDGTPWSLHTAFYSMELVTRGAHRLLMAEVIEEGSLPYLKETLELVQIGYRDRMLVRAPSQNEIAFFRLPDDGRVSVISLMRTGYQPSDEGPVPFRVTFTVMPADRNQLVVEFGEVPPTRAAAADPEPPAF
jgi:GntR family transcriptional regulator